MQSAYKVSSNIKGRGIIPQKDKNSFFKIKTGKVWDRKYVSELPLQMPDTMDTSFEPSEIKSDNISDMMKELQESLNSILFGNNALELQKDQENQKKKDYSIQIIQNSKGWFQQKNLNNSLRPKLKQTKNEFKNDYREVLYYPKRADINDFKLLAQIGNGSYGRVYMALHNNLGMIFALKVMQKKIIKQMGIMLNINREIKLLNYLDHCNIMKLYGYFSDSQNVYIITEYCTDGQLYKTMQQNILPITHVINYLRQICSALQYLHGLNIMHRDLKPENILINIGHSIKICDFGWSVRTNPQELDMRTTFCGTPLYLAPEQISLSSYTKSVDVWALGVMAFEMLTGELPFRIKEVRDIWRIVDEEVSYQKLSHIPEGIEFISRLLEKDNERRVQMRELLGHSFLAEEQQDDKELSMAVKCLLD